MGVASSLGLWAPGNVTSHEAQAGGPPSASPRPCCQVVGTDRDRDGERDTQSSLLTTPSRHTELSSAGTEALEHECQQAQEPLAHTQAHGRTHGLGAR